MEIKDPVAAVIVYVMLGSLASFVVVSCAGGIALLIKQFWKELRK